MNVNCLKICYCVIFLLFSKSNSQSSDESLFLPYTTAAFDASDYYGSGDDSSSMTTSSFTVQPSSHVVFTGSSSSLYPSETSATFTPTFTVSTMTPTAQFTLRPTSTPIASSTSFFSTSSTTSTTSGPRATADCNAPSITNGGHEGSTSHGSRVNVRCNQGFVNSGEETLVCNNGQWSSNSTCTEAAADNWAFTMGLAVGIPLFALFCIILCCCCWCCCLARRRRRRRLPRDDDSSVKSVFALPIITRRFYPTYTMWPTYGTYYAEPEPEHRTWPSAETWTYADSELSDAQSVDSVEDQPAYHVPLGFQQFRVT